MHHSTRKHSVHRQTRTKKRTCQPYFHIGHVGNTVPSRLRKVSSSFKHYIVEKLLAVRDTIDSKIYRYYTTSKPLAHNAFAYQAGIKLGLKVTKHHSTRAYFTFAKHASLSHRQILIQFVHTPKCGGCFFKHHLSTISESIESGRSGLFPGSYHVWSNKHKCTFVFVTGHVPARNYSPIALRVGMIRNPYTRMQSIFSHLRNGVIDLTFDNQFKTHQDDIDQYKTFDSVNNVLSDESTMKRLLSLTSGRELFFPMSYWLCDDSNHSIVDFVFRQEHLITDISKLCSLLGIPGPSRHKPHVNVTKHKVPSFSIEERALIRKWWPQDISLVHTLCPHQKYIEHWRKGIRKFTHFMKQLK